MKKSVGRPRIGTKHAKGIVVAARLTPGEARQLFDIIRQTKQRKSAWIRQALLAAAGVEKAAA
ncbi:MAG: hypothetical protein ABSF38_09210 [Verrucomicrobiota bacterium]|jgi:hypothetical protein